jgi:tetratricopeptide (TPR) repeat protein
LGTVISTWQAVRATRAETVARAAAADAKKAATKAEAINTFLIHDMLAALAPGETLGRHATVEQVLATAAAKVGTAFPDQPEVEAAVRNALGDCYVSLGYNQEAEGQLTAALKIRRDLLGEEHPDTLVSMNSLAGLLTMQDKRDAAGLLFRKVVDARIRVLGAAHPDTIESMRHLGYALIHTRTRTDAQPWITKALATSRDVFGEDHQLTLKAKEVLAVLLGTRGEWEKVEALHRETLAISQRKFGAEHPDTLMCMGNLASTLAAQGNVTDAEPLYRNVLELRRKVLGDKHYHTLWTMCSLAGSLQSRADGLAEAEKLAADAERIGGQVLGDSHFVTLWAKYELATVWQRQGKLVEAERLFRELLATRLQEQPDRLPSLLSVLAALSSLLQDKGEPDKAEALLRDALQVSRTLPTADADRSPVLLMLGELLMDRGDPAGAEAFYREALEIRRAERRPDDLGITTALARLGNNLLEQKKYTQAEPLLRECLKIREDQMPGSWRRFSAQSLLGAALAGQRKYAEAEPLLVQGYEGMKQREARIRLSRFRVNQDVLPEALERLVQLYDAWGKPDEAAKWRKELEALKATLKDPEPKQP